MVDSSSGTDACFMPKNKLFSKLLYLLAIFVSGQSLAKAHRSKCKIYRHLFLFAGPQRRLHKHPAAWSADRDFGPFKVAKTIHPIVQRGIGFA